MPEGVGGISIDTRSLKPGDAFFAIKGDRFDGHDFATAAVKAGAGLLVVAEGKLGRDGTFVADNLLAKHDEKYVPREMKDMTEAQAKQTVAETR